MWNSKNEARNDFYAKTFLCNVIHVFVYKPKMYKKISLKNSKTLKCLKNLEPQMPDLQFLKKLIFPRAF